MNVHMVSLSLLFNMFLFTYLVYVFIHMKFLCVLFQCLMPVKHLEVCICLLYGDNQESLLILKKWGSMFCNLKLSNCFKLYVLF